MESIAEKLALEVSKRGGTTYYVGGYVRDKIMGIPNKDVDVEVHGISPDSLEDIIDSLGERITIGQSFGIYGIKGYDIDIAMPRKETNRGHGHRDFDICVDPNIGTLGASKRRDFTINAMMENVLTGEIVDHFGGKDDIKNKVIRHVNDDTFAEDPLRVLRGAQFAARFEFQIAPETMEICSKMPLDSLHASRIIGELSKALLKASKPSIFFEVLRDMNQLDVWFPELKELINVKQNPTFHAEGDVWNHTMLVLDEAAKVKSNTNNKLAFMLSALAHDLGKPSCTEEIDGKIHAYRHEFLGVDIAREFITRLTPEKNLIDYVTNMTLLHMNPNKYAVMNVKVKTTNKMFDDSICPEDLILLARCDDKGRIGVVFNDMGDSDYEKFLYERLSIYKEYMSRPYVKGKDLIDAGFKPNENFKDILDYAHKLRLAGVDYNSMLKQTINYGRKQYK